MFGPVMLKPTRDDIGIFVEHTLRYFGRLQKAIADPREGQVEMEQRHGRHMMRKERRGKEENQALEWTLPGEATSQSRPRPRPARHRAV